MPTAGEFRGVAQDLYTYGYPMMMMEQTPSSMEYSFGFSGGDVAEVVSLGLGAGAENGKTIRAEVLAVIHELERRAAICDDYSTAMDTYRTQLYVYNTYGPGSEPESVLPVFPPPPPPPQPPTRGGVGSFAFGGIFPMWVEEG